jgi:TonB family protein
MSRGVVSLGLVEPEKPELPPDDGEPGPISPPLTARPPAPGGMAVSTILHLLIIALVVDIAVVRAPEAPTPVKTAKTNPNAVFLPPPAQVRRMLGLPPARPVPVATPPPPTAKDRISIGPPAAMRSPEPLVLHRDQDITLVPKGTMTAGAPVAPPPEPTQDATAARARTPNPQGAGTAPQSTALVAPGPILASLRRLETQTGTGGGPGTLGTPTGRSGIQMGPLFFDPQGADFTEWIQRFSNEVYRNWIVPPAAALGWGGGEVDFEFTVDRSGAVTNVTLVSSSGIPAYDRASRNALVASRLMALPADYAPATLTIKVGFLYGVPRTPEGGHGGG